MKVENDYWILSQGRYIRLFGILPNDWWLKDYTGHLKGLVVTNWYPARSKWNSPSILQIWSDGFDSFCIKFRCSHFHHDLNHCLTLQLFGPLTCYASTPVCGTVRGSNYKFSQLLFELQIFLSFFPSSLSKFAEIALNLFNDCMLKIKFNKTYLMSVKMPFDEKNWKFCRSCFGPWCDQLQRGWYDIGILNSCQRIPLGPVC